MVGQVPQGKGSEALKLCEESLGITFRTGSRQRLTVMRAQRTSTNPASPMGSSGAHPALKL